MYYSDEQTERELARLEKSIKKEYTQAYKELKKKTDDYFASFAVRDAKMKAAIEIGSYPIPAGYSPDQYYKIWRQNQLGRGKRWEKLRDDMAKRIGESNKVAEAYINDKTPGIYSLNYNYEAYQIEGITGAAFDIYNEQTVKRLIREKNHIEFRTVSVNPKRDYQWNTKKINSELTSGILQGKSIKQLSDGFMTVMHSNRAAAIRNARTAVTSAQNGGRQASYDRAVEMGIEVEKEWMAVNDSRTRDSHKHLDGVIVKYNEPFPNNLMYPGDPDGEPAEVYNCRCTMTARLPKYSDHSLAKGSRTGNDAASYKKWVNDKESGAVSGALNDTNDPDFSKRAKHAELYYEEIRNSKKSDFVNAVSKNTGLSKETVSIAYKHVFEDKHMLGAGYKYFDADYDMAESFRRTRTNDHIQKHDITLYKHEQLEYNIMKENPKMNYREAHELASKTYNYEKELSEWLDA